MGWALVAKLGVLRPTMPSYIVSTAIYFKKSAQFLLLGMLEL
jgi:hypothetical protein